MKNYTEACSASLRGHEMALFILANTLSCFLTSSGNGLVLAVVFKTRSLKTVSNILLCSLAFADFLVGILINPLYIAIAVSDAWMRDHPLFKAENYLWMQSLTATTFHLAAISIDRYIAITKSLQYRKIMTERKCALIICSIWVFSFVFAVTAVVIDPKDASKLWVACKIITVLIPFSIMVYCYYYIFIAAKLQASKLTVLYVKNNYLQARDLVKNRKASVTVAIVIGLFVILYLPSFVFSIINFFTTDFCQKMSVSRSWLWAIWLAFTSSTLNPWVYMIRSREFKDAYKKMCSRLQVCSFYDHIINMR